MDITVEYRREQHAGLVTLCYQLDTVYRSRRDHYRGPVPHQRTIVRDRVGHFRDGDGGVVSSTKLIHFAGSACATQRFIERPLA